MKFHRLFLVVSVLGLFFITGQIARGAEVNLRDYQVLVIQDLDVAPGSPAPESSGMQMAEKAAYQVKRYSDRYQLFETVVKEGGRESKEVTSGKKVLVIKGAVKEYNRASVGRRIGRSFIPGGEYTGSASFAASYQFIDQASGKVIHETDLRTTSTGRDDTVEYAMDRNGEALAKLIMKLRGK